MKKSPVSTILLIRICLLLFCTVLALQSDVRGYIPINVILLSYGLYQIIVLGMYWFLMKISAARMLLSTADMLIIQIFILISGGLNSPFLICLCIPVFTMHFLYGIRGLVGGVAGVLLGFTAMIPAMGNMPNSIISISDILIINGIGLILFYIIPYIMLSRGVKNVSQLQSLQKENCELDKMNHKLLALFEMAGRFRLEKDMAQIMNRLLTLCSELFSSEGICIFLIRGGEVEIYGTPPTAEEKEGIYQMIIELKNKSLQEAKNDYVFCENALVIPLIRGTRTDGILYLSSWNHREITNGDTVLFTMIANMVCTYLENLDYVEVIKAQSLSNTSILLNHLDSGKPVKGILDKRIISQELVGQEF